MMSRPFILVNVKSAKTNPKKARQSWGRIAAYRITPEKAELAWAVPDQPAYWFENHMDCCARRRVGARDGRVYYFAQGFTLGATERGYSFTILDEVTGAELFNSRDNPKGMSNSLQLMAVEDRLLLNLDAAHSDHTTPAFYTLDPKEFSQVGQSWKPQHHNTTGYEVYIELPYVDGCYFMRSWQGEVVCHDLRTNEEE